MEDYGRQNRTLSNVVDPANQSRLRRRKNSSEYEYNPDKIFASFRLRATYNCQAAYSNVEMLFFVQCICKL